MLLLALILRVWLTPRMAMPARRCEVVGSKENLNHEAITRSRPEQQASGYG